MYVRRIDGKDFLDEATYEKAKGYTDARKFSLFVMKLDGDEIIWLGNPLEKSIEDIRKQIDDKLKASIIII